MTRPILRLQRYIGLALLVYLVFCTTQVSADSLHDGERLYNEGILPDNSALVAEVMGGAKISGVHAACVNCHRPSGYGSSEGNLHTPAIAASVLFKPLVPRRDRLFRRLYQERQGALARMNAQIPRTRTAYVDEQDLGRALNHGKDPDHQQLGASMPRYDLEPEVLHSLLQYLRTLGSTDDPGVDQHEIHFATVLGPDVPADKAEAMLSVMRSFITLHNREIERELGRPGFSPNYKALYAPSRRTWRLHVWNIDGPPQDWSKQLNKYYQHQPVFAMLSGLVGGEWAPIDRFCETTGLPCLFPLTQWPSSEDGHFTRYLSTGEPGEVELAIRYLLDSGTRDVTLIRVNHPNNRRLVSIFNSMASISGRSLQISDWYIEWDSTISKTVVDDLLDCNRFSTVNSIPLQAQALVLLLSAEQSSAVLQCLDSAEYAGTVMLIGSKIADGRGHPALPIYKSVLLTWQSAIPGSEPLRLYRLRRWLQARRIAVPEFEQIQLNTYLALDATRHALTHLLDRYSREYYLETIEHELENSLNPGTFMRLSLGPEQRFAARGGQVMELMPDGALKFR